MKKLLVLALLAVAGISSAAEIESYEVISGQKGSRAQVCAGLVKEAKKKEQPWNTDRITRFGDCDCIVKPDTDRDPGRQCRLTFWYDGTPINGKAAVYRIVIPKYND